MIKNKKEEVTIWVCQNCKYRIDSKLTGGFRPIVCPKCRNDQFSPAIVSKSPEVITK
jgi:ABC-type ATPase with predicted acetyltransferase domain